MQPAERLPSLDGLRCLSVLAVMAAHAIGTPGFPVAANQAYPWAYLVHYAMKTFFVLSGFLITRQLLDEFEVTGDISLRKFYLRRAYRIFPAAYFYVAFLVVLGMGPLTTADIVVTTTYSVNYYPSKSHYIGHFWSLALEEQFYIFWPALLAYASRKRAEACLAAAIVVCPVVRLLAVCFVPARYGYDYWFFLNADTFACGCLLACARDRLWACPLYRRLLESRWLPTLIAASVALCLLRDRSRTHHFLLVTVINFGVVALVDSSIRFPTSPFGRFLNHAVPAAIGRWSYSLYIWQQVFMNRYSGLPITAFPLNLPFTICAAWLSYRFIEAPLHRYGRKKHAITAPERPCDSAAAAVAVTKVRAGPRSPASLR